MRKALGRGLEALLPSAAPAVQPAGAPAADPPAATVPVAAIVPNREQPRRHFDDDALAALADSIRHHGLLQPLVVRRDGAGYELIAGERRWRAAKRAGLTEVAVVFREADDDADRLQLALIENVQREALAPLEEAEAYRQLVEVYGLTQDEVARRVGKSRPAVANALRLLGLPDPVKEQLARGELSPGHARAVLQLDGAEAQVAFAREITLQQLPKREAERLAAARRSRRDGPGAAPGRSREADVHWKALADELTRTLGTRVRLTPRARGGTIEIEFYSLEHLDGLTSRLRGEPPRAGTGRDADVF